MGYICSLMCFLVCIFSYIRNKRVYHPVVSFAFLYFIITFMSSIRLFNFYSSNDISYIIIMCGVICFAMGSIFSENKKILIGEKKLENTYEFNNKAYYFMLAICLIIILPRFVTIMSYLFTGNSIGDVYVILAGSTGNETGELAQSSIQGLLMQFIAYPILYIIVPTSIIMFFRTFKKRYLLIAIALGLIRVLLDSRRTYLISFFIFILVSFLRYISDKHILNEIMYRQLHKIKKWIPIFLLTIIFTFIFISSSRAETIGHKTSFLGTFYNYYAGCVQYLGYCIENYSFNYTYGFTTLRGLFSPIFGVLELIGINSIASYQEATEIVNGMKYIVIDVAPGSGFNSFTTCFYQFYCDGGYLGIIIISFLFGLYSQSLYKKFIKSRQVRYEARYLYFYGSILMLSFTNMLTILVFIVWPLIIERFMYKKGR